VCIGDSKEVPYSNYEQTDETERQIKNFKFMNEPFDLERTMASSNTNEFRFRSQGDCIVGGNDEPQNLLTAETDENLSLFQTEISTPINGKYLNGSKRPIISRYISNKSKRQVCFSKRKMGLLNKAHVIHTLTGCEILLVVASESGNAYTYSSKKLRPLIGTDTGQSLLKRLLNMPSKEKEDDEDNNTIHLDDNAIENSPLVSSPKGPPYNEGLTFQMPSTPSMVTGQQDTENKQAEGSSHEKIGTNEEMQPYMRVIDFDKNMKKRTRSFTTEYQMDSKAAGTYKPRSVYPRKKKASSKDSQVEQRLPDKIIPSVGHASLVSFHHHPSNEISIPLKKYHRENVPSHENSYYSLSDPHQAPEVFLNSREEPHYIVRSPNHDNSSQLARPSSHKDTVAPSPVRSPLSILPIPKLPPNMPNNQFPERWQPVVPITYSYNCNTGAARQYHPFSMPQKPFYYPQFYPCTQELPHMPFQVPPQFISAPYSGREYMSNEYHNNMPKPDLFTADTTQDNVSVQPTHYQAPIDDQKNYRPRESQ
jgi:SRF-type transcription factor (DNA-binding and dimerisation domain)